MQLPARLQSGCHLRGTKQSNPGRCTNWSFSRDMELYPLYGEHAGKMYVSLSCSCSSFALRSSGTPHRQSLQWSMQNSGSQYVIAFNVPIEGRSGSFAAKICTAFNFTIPDRNCGTMKQRLLGLVPPSTVNNQQSTTNNQQPTLWYPVDTVAARRGGLFEKYLAVTAPSA